VKQWNNLRSLVGDGEALNELVDFADDEPFQGMDVALAEEGTQCRPPHAMDVMLDCLEQRPPKRAILLGTVEPGIPITFVFVATGVDIVKEVWVVDVQMGWIDAYDGAVLLVQFFNLPKVAKFVRV